MAVTNAAAIVQNPAPYRLAERGCSGAGASGTCTPYPRGRCVDLIGMRALRSMSVDTRLSPPFTGANARVAQRFPLGDG